MRANAPQLPGGGWAQLELTDALQHDVLHLYRRARQVQINNLVIQSYCVTVVLVLCFIK